MKTKLIVFGVLIVLVLGVVVLAAKDSIEDLFLSNVDSNVRAEVEKIMNTMTPEQALQLRIQQIAEEYNKDREVKEASEEVIE